MKKEKQPLDLWLNNPEQDWDVFKLPKGHENRFLEKLKEQERKPKIVKLQFKNRHVQYLQFAAVLIPILAIGLFALQYFGNNSNPEPQYDLAEYSTELDQAENHFAYLVEEKIKEVQTKQTPENKEMIDFGLEKIQELEQEYQLLLKDLYESGGNPAVIRSIMANLQLKLDILEQLLQTIEYKNNFNNLTNETI